MICLNIIVDIIDISHNICHFNPLEMGHFYKLLCEEMIFLLHKGKNDFAVEISFLHTKVCGNAQLHNHNHPIF